jgi:archaellum component FlaC
MIVNRIGYGTEIQEVEDLTVAQQASSQQISSADETSREASQIAVSVEGYDSEISDINTSISNITNNINSQTDIILGYSSEISSLKSQMAGLSVSNFF